MSGIKRVLTLVLAAILIGCLVCVPCAIALEVDHDCCGDDCPVCALINLCENVIKALGVVFAVALLTREILFVLPRFRNSMGFCRVVSPVYLKVKLSN